MKVKNFNNSQGKTFVVKISQDPQGSSTCYTFKINLVLHIYINNFFLLLLQYSSILSTYHRYCLKPCPYLLIFQCFQEKNLNIEHFNVAKSQNLHIIIVQTTPLCSWLQWRETLMQSIYLQLMVKIQIYRTKMVCFIQFFYQKQSSSMTRFSFHPYVGEQFIQLINYKK